jgi:hemerythrin-like metal-binding protein
MTSPAWSDALATGIPDIDRYHRHLFEVFEELRFAAQGGTQRAMTGNLMDRLLSGTMEHFAQEEAEMVATGYPHLEHHHAAHESFSDEVVALLQASVSGTTIAAPVVIALAHRLVDHVMTHDQQLAAYLQAVKPTTV